MNSPLQDLLDSLETWNDTAGPLSDEALYNEDRELINAYAAYKAAEPPLALEAVDEVAAYGNYSAIERVTINKNAGVLMIDGQYYRLPEDPT